MKIWFTFIYKYIFWRKDKEEQKRYSKKRYQTLYKRHYKNRNNLFFILFFIYFFLNHKKFKFIYSPLYVHNGTVRYGISTVLEFVTPWKEYSCSLAYPSAQHPDINPISQSSGVKSPL